MITPTRRNSVCSNISTEFVGPLVGVGSSAIIRVRFHLGVGYKTFLRYFRSFSHGRSDILIHGVFGYEIGACSYEKSRVPCSSPDLSLPWGSRSYNTAGVGPPVVFLRYGWPHMALQAHHSSSVAGSFAIAAIRFGSFPGEEDHVPLTVAGAITLAVLSFPLYI